MPATNGGGEELSHTDEASRAEFGYMNVPLNGVDGHEEGAVPRRDVEARQTHSWGRLRLVAIVACCALALFAGVALLTWSPPDHARSRVRKGHIGLWEEYDGPPPTDLACAVQRNAACICAAPPGTMDEKTAGQQAAGTPAVLHGWTCKQWTFQVGDIVFVDAPTNINLEHMADYLVSMFEGSFKIHVGVIIATPPEGVAQNPDNVIVGEAMGDDVSNSTLGYLVARYPWGAVHVRRVDEARFPLFKSRAPNMTAWASARMGERFNRLLILFGHMDHTVEFPSDPGCQERRRALDMYRNGGPKAWFCSMYVAWVLGMAGGLNTDLPPGASADPACELPPWVVKNLQPTPGDLARLNIWSTTAQFDMPCSWRGCFTALPPP